MADISFKNQINMIVAPSQDDHLARKKELDQKADPLVVKDIDGNTLPSRGVIKLSSGLTAIDINNESVIGIADYPIKPINIEPVDNAQNIEERPVFYTTPYMQAFSNLELYSYQLQIFLLDDTPVYDTGTIEPPINMQYRIQNGILQVDTQYKWRVRYQSSNLKWSDWSDYTTFSTEALFETQYILQPKLLLPKDGSIINNQIPILALSAFDAVGGIIQGDGEFQIASDPSFGTIVDSGSGKDIFQGTVPLTRGNTFYARGNHQNDDNSIVSKYSPSVEFLIKGLFRSSRIGLICHDIHDGSPWVYKRVDGDYNEIVIDSEYFVWNPIWNLSVLTGDVLKGTNQLPFGIIPKFWIKSERLKDGPYKDWMSWMIDFQEPTAAELLDGWHVHDAFFSTVIHDYQDHILLSKGVAYSTPNRDNFSTFTTMYGNNSGYYYSYVNMTINNINNDLTNENTRGWHIQTLVETHMLILLGLIEYGNILQFRNQIISNNIYRNYTFLPNNSLIDTSYLSMNNITCKNGSVSVTTIPFSEVDLISKGYNVPSFPLISNVDYSSYISNIIEADTFLDESYDDIPKGYNINDLMLVGIRHEPLIINSSTYNNSSIIMNNSNGIWLNSNSPPLRMVKICLNNCGILGYGFNVSSNACCQIGKYD